MIPFTFHWYAGKGPPLLGVALKVTDDPGQNGFGVAVMDTPAGRFALTIIVIEFDVAGLLIGQAMFEFKTQVTTSPLMGK